LKSDYCPYGDNSPSYYDGVCHSENDHASAEENEDSSQAQNDQNGDSSQAQNDQNGDSSQAQNVRRNLYERAKKFKLTDKQTYEEAKLEDGITRAEMAKIIVSYIDSSQAQNDTDNNDKYSSFTDLNQVNAELQSYIIKACEYGLMGYYSDGETTKERFFPNGDITRAEVATIISRMLRGNIYKGTEEERYQKHL
jgi:hypothetical protein